MTGHWAASHGQRVVIAELALLWGLRGPGFTFLLRPQAPAWALSTKDTPCHVYGTGDGIVLLTLRSWAGERHSPRTHVYVGTRFLTALWSHALS